MWIIPVVKTTYTDTTTLKIGTAGLAIQNPTTNRVNLNGFVIRYYTWPDGQSNPGVVSASDNWCFMKQDSSNIGSSQLSFTDYTSTVYNTHTYINIPDKVVVNEFEPADYWVNNGSYSSAFYKTAFKFKFIVPANFALQSGNNYHSIAVSYGPYYSTPSLNQLNANSDLYFYVPVCYLNGFSIHKCTISSSTITMQFQQALTNG